MSAIESSLGFIQKQTNLPIQEIVSSLPSGLIVLNTQGIIIWMNPAAQNLLGADWTDTSWRTVINTVFSPREDDGHEVSLVNGRRIHVAISSLESLPGELVVLTDFTATRDYEQARGNQQHLLALGRMTAQLAHQIRTPLASAMIYTEHLLALDGVDERGRGWLMRLQDCHSSIEQQIRDLLVFVRGEKLEKQHINLRAWSRALVEKIAILFEGQDIEWQLTNHLPDVLFSLHAEGVNGAILNLINNSIEAQAKRIEITLSLLDGALRISVSDNGVGMMAEVREQAFAPFYTTKAQGTGLGLAVVNAVARAHNGQVEVFAKAGKGCTIELFLCE